MATREGRLQGGGQPRGGAPPAWARHGDLKVAATLGAARDEAAVREFLGKAAAVVSPASTARRMVGSSMIR